MKFGRRKGDQAKASEDSAPSENRNTTSVKPNPEKIVPQEKPSLGKNRIFGIFLLLVIAGSLVGQAIYVSKATHQADLPLIEQQLSTIRSAVNKPAKAFGDTLSKLDASTSLVDQIKAKFPDYRDLIVWDRRTLDQKYTDVSLAKASGFARLAAAERLLEDTSGKLTSSARFYRPALGKETFLVLSYKQPRNDSFTIVQILVPAKDVLGKFQGSIPAGVPAVLLQNGSVVVAANGGEDMDLSAYDISTVGGADLSIAVKLPTPPAYFLATPVIQYLVAGLALLGIVFVVLSAYRKPKLPKALKKKKGAQPEPEVPAVASPRITAVVATPKTAVSPKGPAAQSALSLTDGSVVQSSGVPSVDSSLPSSWFGDQGVRFGHEASTDLPDSSQARAMMRALLEQVYGDENSKQSVILVSDGRETSTKLAKWFSEGLSGSGCDVLNCPDLPLSVLPVLEQMRPSTEHALSVWVGSFSEEPRHTGVLVFENGKAWEAGSYSRWRMRTEERRAPQRGNEGQEGFLPLDDLIPTMVNKMSCQMQTERPIRVVVDFGNGPLGVLAPEVLESVGVEVVPLYAEMDPAFPNRQARLPSGWPSLATTVKRFRANFGVGVSIDGTGLVVFDETGMPVAAHRIFALLASDALIMTPGARVEFDPNGMGEDTLLAIQDAGGIPVPVEGLSVYRPLEQGVTVAASIHDGFGLYRLTEDAGIPDAIHVLARLAVILSADEAPLSERIKKLFGQE